MMESNPTSTTESCGSSMREGQSSAQNAIENNNTVMTDRALLSLIRNGLDQRVLKIFPFRKSIFHDSIPNIGRSLVDFSRMRSVLETKFETPASILSLVRRQCKQNEAMNRAVGCLMGLALGDAMGAPLEFLPVNSDMTSIPVRDDDDKRMSNGEDVKDSRPFVVTSHLHPSTGEIIYNNVLNMSNFRPGQWTDDCSMALAMAESMLHCNGSYNGSDVRVAYYSWWMGGYCNAFRHDPEPRLSVGLGGNIASSLEELMTYYIGDDKTTIPAIYYPGGTSGDVSAVYNPVDASEDAGNGSLMRLAPISIRYHHDHEALQKYASLSSRATHPGYDAAICCGFLSYACAEAMRYQNNHVGTTTTTPSSTSTSTNMEQFLDTVINSYLDKYLEHDCPSETSKSKLIRLLKCDPPSPREACWDWKQPRLRLEESIASRGSEYNGYPVSAGYFGSYCMDGLAMALWALRGSTSLVDALGRVVNLLGDCDTTGAIAGQLAGAYYGYESLHNDAAVGRKLLDDIHRWDPLYEIELRAMLLFESGEEADSKKSV